MCLAIAAPAHTPLSRERLSNAWDNNPDGGGYAFIDDDGKIVVRKHLEWQGFIAGYVQDQRANPRSPFIVHERFATHGQTNAFNVHPFHVDEHTVVIHNGIINCVMSDTVRSDTRTFVEDYLAKLPPTWFDDDCLVDMVSDYIGSGNKLVVLTIHPEAEHAVYIINEKAGHWDRGAWWSNKTYERSYFRKSSTTTKTPMLGWDSKDDDEWEEYFDKKYGTSRPGAGVQSVSAGAIVEPDPEWDDPTQCDLCDGELQALCCFDCEYCALCQKDMWTCGCADHSDVFQAYLNWLDTDRDARPSNDAIDRIVEAEWEREMDQAGERAEEELREMIER